MAFVAAVVMSAVPVGAAQTVPAAALARVVRVTADGPGDLSCAKPQPGLRAKASLLDGAEEEDVALTILKLLGSQAASYGGRYAMGWVLNLIGLQQPSVDPAEIDDQFSEVNQRLNALAQQQAQDCMAVLRALAEVTKKVDEDTYDTLASGMSDQIGLLTTYQQDYKNIVVALQKNGGHVDALTAGDKGNMRDMLSGGQYGLRYIINTIDTRMAGNQPGAEGMVLLFSKVLTDELRYDPYQSHVFPADYVDRAYAQQSYYAGLVTQAAFLYTNVAHLDFSIGDFQNKSKDAVGGIVDLVNTAQSDVQRWSSVFADGPPGSTSNWVSQAKGRGIGAIPLDTVLDYRSPQRPLLWTIAPVALAGAPAAHAPYYYCGAQASFCHADLFDAAGQVTDTRLALPTPGPLASMISDDAHDGLTGWRVPTSEDWKSLQTGATGGLTAWGQTNQLPMFARDDVTSHYGGIDKELTVIAPALVNTGTSANPTYGVLSSANPAANTLTLENPGFAQSSQNAVAGRLFLVQDFQPTTPPQPFTAPGRNVAAHRPGSAPGGKAHRAHKRPKKKKKKRRPVTRRPPSRVSLPGPVRFTQIAACSPASTYKVPDGVGSVTITAVGGGGADGAHQDYLAAHGGVGGKVTETVPVTAGDILYVQVGGGGTGAFTGGPGGGLPGKTNSHYQGDRAGGGGGASGVATDPGCSHWLVVGGGGGGGGSSLSQYLFNLEPNASGGRGGDGCAATTIACTAATSGQGATGDEGGPGGAPPNNHGSGPNIPNLLSAGAAGSDMHGGSGGSALDLSSDNYNAGGGGGGGGYYGGGGGGGADHMAGGGGGAGGASFAIPGGSGTSYGLGPFDDFGAVGSVTITPIAKRAPAISLSASDTSIAWGKQPTLTAHLPADVTGTVGFYNNVNGGCDHNAPGAVCQGEGTAPIVNGDATLTKLTVPLRQGKNDLHASYYGSDHYSPVDSSPVSVQVTKATPAINLAISGTVLQPGEAPTSIVASLPADATGTLGLYNDINDGCEHNNAPGAVCQGEGTAPIDKGYATLTKLTVALRNGKNELHASYGGDDHYNPADSDAVTVTVGLTKLRR